ncbi:MAG: nucleoside triphosphate pyrophosphohydrolase [Acutalibacteraceae bacterium]
MEFKIKESYKFDDLVAIMKLLRAPGGCPWDREQTHKSIRQNFIEETYEVIEAIDTDDKELLKEELGDVLLQVVFHAELESEKGEFNIDDVADGICKKLIIRHPHVFADVKADTAQKVLSNWDKIKMQTKSQTTQTQAMESVSRALPALMRSTKIQQKASKIGFDWDNADGAFSKVEEELSELKQANRLNDADACEEELGDLLFSVVNVSRFVGADAEKSLYRACDKFINRFSVLERLADERGIDIKQATLTQLDSLWDEAKECQN